MTRISYFLAADQHVKLEVYDSRGRLVQTLVDEWQAGRSHHVDMSARDLPGGAYFYRLTTDSVVEQRKMLLVR